MRKLFIAAATFVALATPAFAGGYGYGGYSSYGSNSYNSYSYGYSYRPAYRSYGYSYRSYGY